jgi:surfeit locus 1 family protein
MRWHFRATWWPTLAFVLLLPAFILLGLWQLQRADEKRALQAEYDARATAAPVRIGASLMGAEDLRFHRVLARGYYEPRFQVLVDNRVHRGQAGYHVVTPLRLADSDTRLLVNRGWVPLGASRAQLPALETPAGLQEVSGVATVPHARVFQLQAPEPLGERWQPVWQHLDLARYREATRFALQPVVLLLDPDSPAGGFMRDWSRLDAGIAVHQGYAFQWFSLALALLGLYVFLGWRAGRPVPAERPRDGDDRD